jgi:hypothetical protein
MSAKGIGRRSSDIVTPNVNVGGPPPPNYVSPVYAYTHPDPDTVPPISPIEFSGRAVIGGHVYRGPDPSLQGKYIFMDSIDNNHWIADANPFGNVTNIDALLSPNIGFAAFPVSFGEDAVGNLYITYLNSGEVYRIATNEFLAGDYDHDGDVDAGDYDKWRKTFGASGGAPAADSNGNGVVDGADYVVWRNNLGASVHGGASSATEVPELAAITYIFLFAFAVFLCHTDGKRR